MGTSNEFSLRLRDCIQEINNSNDRNYFPRPEVVSQYADKYGIRREFVAKVCGLNTGL